MNQLTTMDLLDLKFKELEDCRGLLWEEDSAYALLTKTLQDLRTKYHNTSGDAQLAIYQEIEVRYKARHELGEQLKERILIYSQATQELHGILQEMYQKIQENLK